MLLVLWMLLVIYSLRAGMLRPFPLGIWMQVVSTSKTASNSC